MTECTRMPARHSPAVCAVFKGLGFVCLFAVCPSAVALSSHECAAAILRPPSTDASPSSNFGCEAEGICGSLPASPLSFSSRLSSECSALFESYQSSWSKLGISNLVSHDATRPCSGRRANSASNPIVISSNSTATFAMCTVPKSGCSNMRKLLYALVADPLRPKLDALTQFEMPHHYKYPTVWYYDVPSITGNTSITASAARRLLATDPASPSYTALWQPKIQKVSTIPEASASPDHTSAYLEGAASMQNNTTTNTADTLTNTTLLEPQPQVPPPTGFQFGPTVTAANPAPDHIPIAPKRLPPDVPTFVVGRNPYVRLVSGFRDKMLHNPARTDHHTMRDVNTFLGVPESSPWADTPAAFQLFIHALWDRGITTINEHFRPAVNICGGTHRFMHDYYLPLEQIQRWFPCWMDGLGLRGWTEGGWGDSPYGRMLIGSDEETFLTLKAYGPAEDAAPRWDAEAGAASGGVRGEDWDLVRGNQCWWNPPGMSCGEYYASFTAQDGRVVPGGLGGEEQGGGAGAPVTDPHVTESGVRWEQYYDQVTADVVFLLYAIDFETFGYERFVVSEAG